MINYEEHRGKTGHGVGDRGSCWYHKNITRWACHAEVYIGENSFGCTEPSGTTAKCIKSRMKLENKPARKSEVNEIRRDMSLKGDRETLGRWLVRHDRNRMWLIEADKSVYEYRTIKPHHNTKYDWSVGNNSTTDGWYLLLLCKIHLKLTWNTRFGE